MNKYDDSCAVIFRAKPNNSDEYFEKSVYGFLINHFYKSSIADALLCSENASDYIKYKLI